MLRNKTVSPACLAAVLALHAPAAMAVEPSPRTPQIVAPLADLMGLTHDEVQAKLLLRPASRTLASEIAIVDGARERTLSASDMEASGGQCGRWSRADVVVTGGAKKDGMSRLVFREGKLSAIRHGETRDVFAADASVESDCYVWKEDSPGYLVPAMVLYSPFIIIGALGASPRIASRLAAIEALAALRLGEAPPGGLTGYRSAPPKSVSVNDGPDGTVLLTVSLTHLSRNRHPDLVRVSVLDGRITSIVKDKVNFVPCALTPAWSLRCDLVR